MRRFVPGPNSRLTQGEVDSANIANNNPLVRSMQEATGEKTWWIQQARYDDPHLVMGVADTGAVHMSNDPNQGELPRLCAKVYGGSDTPPLLLRMDGSINIPRHS